jgi:hypothetical protein
MGHSASQLKEVVISTQPFQLGQNPWQGWELEEQGGVQYDAHNTHIARYHAGTPGVVTSQQPLRVVVDGKEFTLTPEQLAHGWELKQPLRRNWLE